MSDKNFAVWARKEALPSAAYALEIGPKILSFLEDYYKIKFPLPKIDMIALPDFKAGAMENWGLLTFRLVPRLLLSLLIILCINHRGSFHEQTMKSVIKIRR